jgi:hypothetical protein
VHGGYAPRATGLDIANLASLEVFGGSLTGGGTGGAASEATGARLQGVGQATFDGVAIVGGAPIGVGAGGQLQRAQGIAVVAADAVTGPVLVTGCEVTGGDEATERLGISATQTPLTVELSSVSGSLTPGGRRAVGISLTGLVAVTEVTIIDNKAITGGAPGSSNQGVYSAFGVEIAGVNPTLVQGNALIAGCSPACTGVGVSASNVALGAGVRVSAGAGHVIEGNALISGGTHDAAVADNTSHSGILAGFPAASSVGGGLVGLTVSGNTAIVGNADPALTPAVASGFAGRDIDVTLQGNASVLGGYAREAAAGVLIVARAFGPANEATIRDNTVAGGVGATSATGVAVSGTLAVIQRNVIDACGLPGTSAGAPPAACLPAPFTTGLLGTNNPDLLVTNNFVFGGYGALATGCDVAARQQLGGASVRTALVYNLCLAQGRAAGAGSISQAVGLRLHPWNGPAADHDMSDNILSAGDVAFARYGVDEDAAVASMTLRANAFVPDAGVAAMFVAYYLHDSLGELDSAAAVNALNGGGHDVAGNVATDPLFAAADPYAPSAAGYHLNPNCVLANLGEPSPHEAEDYDLQARDDGSDPTAPEMGPDECD